MDWKLELVVVPVSDVDTAKAFYTERVGFHVDLDHRVDDQNRVVQLTPPGSACSIAIGNGIGNMPPGTMQGLQLVVTDILTARAELAGRGVDVSPVQVRDRTSPDWVTWDAPERPPDWGSFVFFKDPDGNS